MRVDFQLNVILDIFSPSSEESILDIYSVDTDGVGEFTDERLADSVMGVALSRSRLMQMLINEAYDFAQELE